MTYKNSKDVTFELVEIVNIEAQLKTLYQNKYTADENIVYKLEQEYIAKKFNIIEWFSLPENYDLYKNSPEGNHSLFMKKVKEGIFDHEIGLDVSLKDKIYKDFLQKYNLTPREELLTDYEKKLLNQNNETNDSKSTLVSEGTFLLSMYSRAKCFEKSWEYVQNSFPSIEQINPKMKNFIKTIKENTHFLSDHPHHFLINKGSTKDKSPALSEVFDTVQKSFLGDKSSMNKIDKIQEHFNVLKSKAPINEKISELRDKAIPKNVTQLLDKLLHGN